MLNLMTIRTQDDTFLNFSLDSFFRLTTMNHISNSKILLIAIRMVELQSSKVSESASVAS